MQSYCCFFDVLFAVLGTVSLFKMKKISLPVDVRRSKTPLLNLPSDGNFVAP